MRVQAAPNVNFSPLEPLPKIGANLEAHEWGGTLLEILSGLGVPTLVAKMLIGTATGYGPKAQHFADVWKQSSEL